jgi:antirestriction protein ArdC
MAQCKRDVYAEILDGIISQLEKGCAPWRQPWRTDVAAEGPHVPHNAATGRRYNGINILQLWAAAAARGYASHGWLTFKQARELGGTVRKGETGTPVVYWAPKERRTVNDAGQEETSRYLMLRYFTVFHVSQTEGCTLPQKPSRPLPAPVDPDDAMGVVRPLLDRVALRGGLAHEGVRAFYAPSADAVRLPRPELFTSLDAYRATLIHELAHSTGAEHRVGRNLTGRFGSDSYSMEEMVADICSAMTQAGLGLRADVEAHASYVDSWLAVLKRDRKALLTAASAAQKAADWLLPPEADADTDEETQPEPMALAA